MRVGLGVAWGVLAARPLLVAARRAEVTVRLRGLPGAVATRGPLDRRTERLRRIVTGGLRRLAVGETGERVATTVRNVLGAPGRARRSREADDALAAEVAAAVDVLAVAVSAGCTPFLAIEEGARWCPPRVSAVCREVVRACAVGATFDDAMAEAGRNRPALRGLTDALRTSASLGTPAGPALARLGAEQRADLRRRAEARARTVPVRLCLPLVGCILPAFALLTVVPVVFDGLRP